MLARRGARSAPARGAGGSPPGGAAGVSDKSRLVPAPETVGTGDPFTPVKEILEEKALPSPRPAGGNAFFSREMTVKYAAVAPRKEQVI